MVLSNVVLFFSIRKKHKAILFGMYVSSFLTILMLKM